MPALPRISGREAVVAFQKAGFVVKHQRGSHIMLDKPGFPMTLAVPDHRQVSLGTLRSLIRDSGLTVDEFIALL